MKLIAVLAWCTAIGFGVFMLAIWLVELDRDVPRTVATRMPIPVISAHALLAIAGVPVWLVYLVTDEHTVAWLAAAMLACVAVLGLTMAIRWIGVLRTTPRVSAPAVGPGRPAPAVPAEREFPVAAVISHGIAAVTTVTFVVLIALGIGGGLRPGYNGPPRSEFTRRPPRCRLPRPAARCSARWPAPSSPAAAG
jgi:hypothetical protein